MSSEEEMDKKTKGCRILRKDWRHPDLIAIFKWLDYHADKYGLTSSGATIGTARHPRLRQAVGTAKHSNGPVIAGLLLNFYNSTWLASCREGQLSTLKATSATELLTYVTTWPTNSEFGADENDQDEYWKPPTSRR